MGEEKEGKDTSYTLLYVISGISNGSESWWHLWVSLKEVLGLIMCHQSIYHLWTWRSRSEGRALSYQSFIMEIMHVQENKPLSLPDKVCVSHSIMSDSLQPHGLKPARLLFSLIFPARILKGVAISFSREVCWIYNLKSTLPKLEDTEVSLSWE